jgi:hypothetical protein
MHFFVPIVGEGRLDLATSALLHIDIPELST